MRKKEITVQKQNSFVVLMTSLSVILLAFFILLNTYAKVDNRRVKKALGSLTGTFGILPGGFRSEKGETVLPTWAVDLGIEGSIQSLEEFFREAGKEGDLQIDDTDEGLVLNIASRVLFYSGRADLKSEGNAALDAIAEIIKITDRPFRIGGHTDNVPIHNERFDSNWDLSAARALEVLRYFVEKWEVPASRLSAVGFSEYRPLVPNTTEENRAKNRRVSIILLKKEDKGDSRFGDLYEKEAR